MASRTSKASSRRFTKQIIVVNLALVWVLMFTSVFFEQSENITNSGFALIGTLFGVYTGIGHLDFRKAVESIGIVPAEVSNIEEDPK